MAMEVLDIDTLTQLLMYGTDDYPVMLLLMRPGTILEVAQILKGTLSTLSLHSNNPKMLILLFAK